MSDQLPDLGLIATAMWKSHAIEMSAKSSGKKNIKKALDAQGSAE
ncbi:hypothetical protein [Nitrosovibrio sp. Nv6]|nr:hypothetical protein [Nitrosovibrio sp. Nv6]